MNLENKKFKKIMFSFSFTALFLPSFIFAQGLCEELVPCTLQTCTLCDFFKMFQRIINCILFGIVPPLAVFMVVVGGALYIGAVFEFLPGGMETVSRAKRLFTSVVIGLLIVYGSWLIINLFLVAMGYTSPTGRWWEIECRVQRTRFEPPADVKTLKSVPVKRSFSADGVIDLESLFPFLPRYEIIAFAKAAQEKPIFALSLNGKITLNSPTSVARIILVDKQGKEYLAFQAEGPFNAGEIVLKNNCHETCVLDGVWVSRLKIEVDKARVEIEDILILDNKEGFFSEVKTTGVSAYRNTLAKEQSEEIIQKINFYNISHGLKWTAGETEISSYSLEQKKRLLGVDRLPNLQGLEYYKGGIFEFKSDEATNYFRTPSNFPRSFDWRNRHGKNWMTSVKNQGNCGSCWAFAAVGAIEAVTNLYFNQQINLDLSEQDLVSCYRSYGANGCQGLAINYVSYLYDYLKNSGVTYESCFPYSASDSSCVLKCQQASQLNVKISGGTRVSTNEDIIRSLITKGPLQAGVIVQTPQGAFGHAIVLVGYETDTQGNLVWIFKNSWGSNWGENGYFRVADSGGTKTGWFSINSPIFIKDKPDLKINCEDKDGDGYCFWGISPTKPPTCPENCKPEADCNDANPNVGPFGPNFSCGDSPMPPTPTPPTPTPPTPTPPTPTPPTPTPPPQCTNECVPGEQICCSATTYRVCGNFDSDPCYEWSDCRYCSAGTRCINGFCEPEERPQCYKDADCPRGSCSCTTPPDEWTCGQMICTSYSCLHGKCVKHEEINSCVPDCCPRKCLESGACAC